MSDLSNNKNKIKKDADGSQEELDRFTVLQETVETDLDADVLSVDEEVAALDDAIGAGLLNVASDRREELASEAIPLSHDKFSSVDVEAGADIAHEATEPDVAPDDIRLPGADSGNGPASGFEAGSGGSGGAPVAGANGGNASAPGIEASAEGSGGGASASNNIGDVSPSLVDAGVDVSNYESDTGDAPSPAVVVTMENMALGMTGAMTAIISFLSICPR